MSERLVLRVLADSLGILPSYVDIRGETRETTDSTRVALLAAMGVDGSTEEAARHALEADRAAMARQMLPHVRVVQGVGVRTVPVAGPLRAGHLPARWAMEVRAEDGTIHHVEGTVSRRTAACGVRIRLPAMLPFGYHTVRVLVESSGGVSREAEQLLIVTPPRCPAPADRLGARRAYGILANLYTVRSERNWGIGNLGDLRALVAYARHIGAAFVGINPLHAIDNRDAGISPYCPISRLYRNVLYLDVTRIPELAEAPAVKKRLAQPAFGKELERLRAAEHVDYERVMALERPVLEALHRVFARCHRARDTPRGRAYRRYLAREGELLDDFATFSALQSAFARQGKRHWKEWPAVYHRPRSDAVRAFRNAHREEVDFHCYLQFELDRQLAIVAAHSRARGLSIGIYQDLAVGSAMGGSDGWGFPGLFIDRVRVGAPPDDFATEGQIWGLPPVDPRRLAAERYCYWIRLVRAALGHGGALRIDHVMGMFRQFWIPVGRSAAEGAYVRFPARDLLGILALESSRAGVIVIGEDLGTVPRGLSRTLARWGILSSRVLYFGRTRRGTYWPARRFPARALVAANTHDMVPLAGFRGGHDLAIRRRAGLLKTDSALRDARTERARSRRGLLRRLRAEGLLPAGRMPATDAELPRAVHGFLCRTPAVLVGISLDDLTGEVTPVNQPGAPLDRYAAWSRRMRLPIEALRGDPDVNCALARARASARNERPYLGRKRGERGNE